MAMLPCPDCKKMISPSAQQCPKCGCQITEEYKQKISEKQKRNKRINKKIFIFAAIAFLVIAIAEILITPPKDIAYGKLLSVADNRKDNGTVSVRVRIEPNLTNKMTIEENYINAVDLVTNRGFDNCELRYFAVAKRTDGKDGKIMNFIVPAPIVDKIASGEIVAAQLPDYVTDLWINSQFTD